jgi:hypothetical protein
MAKHNETLRTNMQNKFCQNNKLQVNTGTTDSVQQLNLMTPYFIWPQTGHQLLNWKQAAKPLHMIV